MTQSATAKSSNALSTVILAQLKWRFCRIIAVYKKFAQSKPPAQLVVLTKIFNNRIMLYSDIIKDIMVEQGLSQEVFAKAIGVHQTTVGQWILGKKEAGL